MERACGSPVRQHARMKKGILKSMNLQLKSLSEAIQWTLQTFQAHPERDYDTAFELAYKGLPRPWPVIYLAEWFRTDDTTLAPPGEWTLPEIAIRDPEEARLAALAVNLMRPLAMDNPVHFGFPTGFGPGTLAASLGARVMPEFGYTPDPSFAPSLDEILALPEPGMESGLLPAIRKQIGEFKQYFPPEFKIHLSDLQGPFNLAHAVLGTNIFYAPYDDPEKFDRFMDRVTRHWIDAHQSLRSWIGEDRLTFEDRTLPKIAECSVNLVSTEFYEEFILKHDLVSSAVFPHIHMHPCSGPHVFYATLKHLPNIASTEAGSMESRMAAGSIRVDEALAALGNRPILLNVGQELPEGKEYEFICRDIDRYASNRRIIAAYTGPNWLRKDRQKIRDLHRRVDEYFLQKYGN